MWQHFNQTGILRVNLVIQMTVKCRQSFGLCRSKLHNHFDFDQNDNFKFCSDVSHFKLEIKKERIYWGAVRKFHV